MGTVGYWREPLKASLGSALIWQSPGPMGLRVWVGLLNGQPVARISRQPGHGSGCSAAIDGWMWTEQEPGSTGERLGVRESPTRGFRSVLDAKRAIEAALAEGNHATHARATEHDLACYSKRTAGHESERGTPDGNTG